MMFTMYELALLNLLVMVCLGVTYGCIEIMELRAVLAQVKRTNLTLDQLVKQPDVAGAILFNGFTGMIDLLEKYPKQAERLIGLIGDAIVNSIRLYLSEVRTDEETFRELAEIAEGLSIVGAEATATAARTVIDKASKKALKEELPFVPAKYRPFVARFLEAKDSKGKEVSPQPKQHGGLPPL